MLRRSRLFVLAVFVLLWAIPLSHAEEGFWTFHNPPLNLLKAKYGLTVTRAWLDHLRLSSVRFSNGGSGAFVSPNGLLLTNQHVAQGQLQKYSTAKRDLIRDGFYAARLGQELKCPDLEVDVLVAMTDVTIQVRKAGKGMVDGSKAQKAMDDKIIAIEREGSNRSGLRAEVVSLYHGGEYWLYEYKPYTDIRLVFAPEQQVAFFGGDLDNWTYPRFDLDIALFRVYEYGKPLKSNNFLKWSTKGATPGSLVFISGNPTSSERQETMAQLEFRKEISVPLGSEYLHHRLSAMKSFAATGPEQARLVASTIFGLQNSLKINEGRAAALSDNSALQSRQREEDEFRRKIASEPELERAYGDAWDTIASGEQSMAEAITTRIFRRTDSRLFGFALDLVEIATELAKPDADRLPQFHDSEVASLKDRLLSPEPFNVSLEELNMSTALRLGQEKLGAKDPYLDALIQEGDIELSVKHLVEGTKLISPEFRKTLLDGGSALILTSTDPMIVAARRVDIIDRETNARVRNIEERLLAPASEKLGAARLLLFGKDIYPDATSSPRFSFGTIEGYSNDGTVVPPVTTFFGLYDRAASFGYKPPFDLTLRQIAARKTIALSTSVNFAVRSEILAGYSGAPVTNTDGELVGVVFDGNNEALANDLVYAEEKGRAVAVDSLGMLEAMRKIYHANALVNELDGRSHSRRAAAWTNTH